MDLAFAVYVSIDFYFGNFSFLATIESKNKLLHPPSMSYLVKSSCGHVTYQNVTYFESPNFPLASQNNLGACTLTILLARNVKQLFLEFIFFETLPPTNGNCIQDQFTIHTDTGSMHKEVPIICGIATGQHSKTIY